MKQASRSTIAMDTVGCATLAEPRKPTAAGLSGIQFQPSYDPVSLVQYLPTSKSMLVACAIDMQAACRCRALGCPVHFIGSSYETYASSTCGQQLRRGVCRREANEYLLLYLVAIVLSDMGIYMQLRWAHLHPPRTPWDDPRTLTCSAMEE
jgi:hypothetical protein